MLRLQTTLGPVGLREPRNQHVELQLQSGTKTINRRWLENVPDDTYHQGIKQAMLIGARQLDLNDAQDPLNRRPVDIEQLKAKIQQLHAGQERIAISGHRKSMLKVVQRKEDRERHLLVKFSKRCCCDRRERSFIIDNGELLIYKSSQKNAKLTYPAYKLKDGTVFTEARLPGTLQRPKFDEGYSERLRIDYKERQDQLKSSFYLYTQDKVQMKQWKRAFNLARVLVSENDRRVLKVSIGRAISASMIKGWNSLMQYFREMDETKQLVKKMSMRLMQADMSRGWTKIGLVNKKLMDGKKKHEEQQLWAARFMSEKLARLGGQSAKSAADVRESIVTKIQNRFRIYRDEKIFDRNYPIGAAHVSRMRQARQGFPMDVSLEVTTCNDVLLMSLQDKQALAKWGDTENRETPHIMLTKKSSYSEVNIRCATMHVHVADNLQTLSLSQAAYSHDRAQAHLTKADWSNFVNLDRISSVVLHSAPVLGALSATDSHDTGVWCTVLGPRLGWSKRVEAKHVDKKHSGTRVVGAPDGFAVPRSLSEMKQSPNVKWVSFKARVGQADWSLGKQDQSRSNAQDGQDQVDRQGTILSLHMLGWRFTSDLTQGDGPDYGLVGEASIPVAVEDGGLVALDRSVLAVEVTEVLKRTTKDPRGKPVSAEEKKLILVGSNTLASALGLGEGGSLAESCKSGGKYTVQLSLLRPEALPEDGKKGSVTITVEMSIKGESRKRDEMVVSPEFVGGGLVTTLYTSHRGAWFDCQLGPGQFRLDHVANFVEIGLGTLHFPHDDQPPAEDGKPPVYRIRISLSGCSAMSNGMYRPKAKWAAVVGAAHADPSAIKFSGSKLYLPLPPGCWGELGTMPMNASGASGDSGEIQSSRPQLDIDVLRSEEELIPPRTYDELVNADGQGVRQSRRETVVYHTSMTFDGMFVDQVKSVSAFFAKGPRGTRPQTTVDVFTNVAKGKATEAVLNIDFSLRDRDYVKGSFGQSDQSALCVGDTAMICTEEPVSYPQTNQEFRVRFCQGSYIDGARTWPAEEKDKGSGKDRGAKLREPCLSSEYAASGLGDLVPKVHFKQGVIPNYCTDIMPHKFVMPLTEKQFKQQNKPGIYPIILDALTDEKKVTQHRILPGAAPKTVVTHLTHMSRRIPITLLAMYADGTCDVEVATTFMDNWRRQPDRRFALPGVVSIAVPEEPKRPRRRNTLLENEEKQDGPRPLVRAILRMVPITALQGAQSAGFHVYDAEFKTIGDVKTAPPAHLDFNPREMSSRTYSGADKGENKFSVQAGPLPADVCPSACQHEWSLHVRSPNESEMHRFVATLRQCVRMDHHQQASKMQEYQTKEVTGLDMSRRTHGPVVGGQLEVVLVEARRLQPVGLESKVLEWQRSLPWAIRDHSKVTPLNHEKMASIAGTTSGELSRSTPTGTAINTFVNFRMIHNGGEVLPYKAQKVQHSPVVEGTDSPCWSSLHELRSSGGWTFRTGLIDPEKLQDLLIHFEVMQLRLGKTDCIGSIQLAIAQKPNLVSSSSPFKNLWLPLVSIVDGKPVVNTTGEIHIMTRWLPAEKLHLAPGQQQLSVRSHFLKELWPKVCSMRLKEPIYNFEVQYMHYCPNIVRDKTPETPADHFRRHCEELFNTVPYVECLERRQTQKWDEFEQKLSDDGSANIRIGELRLKWISGEDILELKQLEELIQAGIPSARRERIWLEITMASRVLELDGLKGAQGGRRSEVGDAAVKAAEADYKRLLVEGLPQRSDANMQLQEDAFHLASLESTAPPVPAVLDHHLRRLKCAQNVCTALIASEGGIAYCESLLVLAFFMLLPQGWKDADDDGKLHHMSESSAFWLLYTLTSSEHNGTFKEYYGKPAALTQEETGITAMKTLCVSSGAMQDVALLECCLAYHEPEIWKCLNAIGFQLPCVFYGAFMRLYATYLPTASVFRFWDILFSQSSDPKVRPHARVHLVDLAFGVIRAKKAELLLCTSADEVQCLLLGVMGSMYDMSTAIDITLAANRFLWGGGGFSFGKVGHLWTQREELFKRVNETSAEQNEILRLLTHEQPLGRIPQTKYESPPGAKGVTTKELLKDVLPVIQQAFESLRARSQGVGKYWAMHRPMPLAAHSLNEDTFEKAVKLFNHAMRGNPVDPVPRMVGPAGGGRDDKSSVFPGREPLDITAGDMSTVLQKDLPNWGHFAAPLWKAFTNRRDVYIYRHTDEVYSNNEQQYQQQDVNSTTGWFQQQVGKIFGNTAGGPAQGQREESATLRDAVSLNELFIALICCSRGTLGEKAAALFNIYSYVEPMQNSLLHRTPISRLAKSITKTGDGSGEGVGKNLAPPDPENINKNALHFQVWSNFPTKNTLVGDVFVPTLGSYIGYNPADAEVQGYNIWGATPKERKGKNQRSEGSSGDKVCVGDMEMAITWTPKSIKHPEEGQLCVRLKSIRFYKMHISDFFKMNPRVTLKTYRDEGGVRAEVKIPRWDPRGLLSTSQHASWITTHGAYGGDMDWGATMKDGFIGHGEHFRHRLIEAHDMGYNQESEEWCWNEAWGKQSSVENVRMQPEFMALTQRKNVMDIQGVRHIVQGILQRSLLQVTNRQAILIADALFNRQGAVPGIIEAILVQGESPSPSPTVLDNESLVSLKAKFKNNKTPFVSVTNEIALEHEREIALNGGFLNLFMPEIRKGISLGSMHIKEHFSGKKTLWIRYVRSGDGERCTQGAVFDSSGQLQEDPVPEIKIDLLEAYPQTKVTKEEFISCIMHSPLLGESMRRIGATDHVMQPKKSIALDLTVMDPHHEEEDEQFMDALNVQQSILLEVWDSDVTAKDFLGEAWLPPLSSMNSTVKDFVLPLTSADFSDDGDDGASRYHQWKEITGDAAKSDTAKDPNKQITGELYIKVGWRYPAYEMTAEGECTPRDTPNAESIKNRALVQEKLHTGRLTLQVLRARNLRRSDAVKGRDCDPQVSVWLRNDYLNQWRKKPLARTSLVRNNRNPEWKNEFKDPFDIMTGVYEARFPPKEDGWFEEVKAVMRKPRAKRWKQEERETAAVKSFGSTGLRLKFAETGGGALETNAPPPAQSSSDGAGEGENHQVEVYLGDSIREFKSKVTLACEREAAFHQERGDSGSEAKYKDVNIGHKHVVMVFVPSGKVQRLYAQKLHEGQEYKHAYNQAIQDPSSWQPLDPTRTFGQYPQFGFGRKQAQLLRIVETVGNYKLVNLRFKEFDKELSKKAYYDTNESDRCYGWAKYFHRADQTYEWRPAFIGKAVDGDEAPATPDLKYKVEWICKPLMKGPAEIASNAKQAAPPTTESLSEPKKKSEVLLAPRCPAVDVSVHSWHREVLEQCQTLRMMGKSDWEIEGMLNKMLDDKWELQSKSAGADADGVPAEASKPPRVTVDIIRGYMLRRETQEASKQGGADAHKKAMRSR